ncbi:MAG: hypothetical protein MZW92_22665 [Comamonadaceae bacterium]|nr:hypothetical protein [Comamonadaceae bacterium]
MPPESGPARWRSRATRRCWPARRRSAIRRSRSRPWRSTRRPRRAAASRFPARLISHVVQQHHRRDRQRLHRGRQLHPGVGLPAVRPRSASRPA